jgi:chromatin modification-related protein VID21
MRLDFAEERRWKRMVAREFAYQVVEWHLSSPKAKAELMITRNGWTHVEGPVTPRPAATTEGKEGHKRSRNGSRKDTADNEEKDDGMTEDTSGEVLEELLPRRAKRGRGRPKRLAVDEDEEEETVEVEAEQESSAALTAARGSAEPTDEMEVDDAKEVANRARAVSVPDGEVEADAEGEVDADGEADALGEEDGEGSADIVDGVIGLEGRSDIHEVCLHQIYRQMAMRMPMARPRTTSTWRTVLTLVWRRTQSALDLVSNSQMALYSVTDSQDPSNSARCGLQYLIHL